jgi:negative regulator of flagellin synthesis FlgM
MSIEGLGPVDPISKYNRTDKPQQAKPTQEADSVSFSDEAKMRAEVYKATETVRAESDVRMDRVEEVKRRLADPTYIDNKVLESVADRIMDVFGL